MYTVAEAKENLIDGIRVYLLKDKSDNYIMKEVNRLPFYLEGGPGIGKTEVVAQVAEELGIGFVSFSLTHHTRNSLLGLPVIEELQCGKYTEYTMSEIIAKVMEKKEQGYKEGILLLDEFSCVSDSIMPAMLAFLQTKNIGAHSLPEGWIIVLCGNPKEYNKNARSFDAAVLDRLRKLKVRFEPKVFISYAREKGFHPTICDYLEKHENYVYKCVVNSKEETLVTCRGWENLSHAIYGMEQLDKPISLSLVTQFIRDEKIAAGFLGHYKLNCIGLSRDKIVDLINGNQKYYVKYFEGGSLFSKWNSLEVIAGVIGDKAKELVVLDERRDLAQYFKGYFDTVNNLYQAISNRLAGLGPGNVFGYQDGGDIPRWDKEDVEYKELDEIEERLLYDLIVPVEDDDFYDVEETEMICNQDIMDRLDEIIGETDRSIQLLKLEISGNISNFISFAEDIDEGACSICYRCYQLINENRDILSVAATTRNPDYVRLCKANYGVSA
ncbi:MAG: AAA family ATPase [Lachnospiraceae bacterium]|nr:AAA family ATPase [Lachnospiraceae bacterium]